LAGAEIVFFAAMIRFSVGHTQSPSPWIPESEADQSPPSSAEVKDKELYLHSSLCLHDVVLKHRGKFTFALFVLMCYFVGFKTINF
jgi:hypothetical protein